MTTIQALDFDQDDFMDDYSRGMDMLRLASRAFSVMASGIGYPIANPRIGTAQVSTNLDAKRIEFEINPNFIRHMKDSEIAAVIAHETYHVLLGHLGDMVNTTDFPKRKVLIDAQECIINDGLPGNVGFATPDGTWKGLQRHNQDFSAFSTKEGYEFILKKLKDEEEPESDKADDQEKGEKGDSDGSSSGSGSDAPDEKEKDEAGDDAPEAEGDDQESGAGTPSDEEADDHDPTCGGPQITGDAAEDMTDEEIAEAVKKVLGEAVDAAVEEMNAQGLDATPELEEMLEDLKNAGVYFDKTPNLGNSNAPKDAFSTIDRLSGMNMNWVELLAIINPKLKTSGRPKYRDAWHAPRRKMLHSYQNVILPTRQRMDDPNKKKGDSVPTFIIALDMSGSIPTRLLGDLASLAQSVPVDLIKPFPITWSDNFKIFDSENPNNICHRGGTRLESVYNYADQVRREEGVDPYVLVITDGGFSVPSGISADKLNSKWYWMAIQSADVSTIKKATRGYTEDARIFNLQDFV